VETGVLVGQRGAYRLTGPVEAIQVPATVQSILAARIDRLPAEDKGLLQIAAVIGERVPHALLEAVADVPNERLRPALARLHAAEFVYEATRFPDLESTFKHALTHDVAYASLLHDRRRDLHGRITTAIEQLSGDRPSEDVDRLAHHALRGEVWDKAVGYLRRAGARATTRSAHREAVGCFEQALEALRHLPASHERTALAVDLRLDLRTALTPLGHYRRILDLLHEAEALAAELQDDRRLGHVIADMSARFRNTGDHAGALEAGRRACAIAAALGDPDLQFEATYRLAQAHFAVGDVSRSVDLLRQTLAAADLSMRGDSRLPGYLAAWPRAWLAIGLARLGEFEDAIQNGEAAVRLAESAAHPHTLIEAQSSLGRVHLDRGDLARAIALFELGLVPSRAWNIWDSSVFSGLGYAYALAGRVAEALPLLQEAVERGQTIDALGLGHAMRLSRLGHGYLVAGRDDEARECAQHALEFSRAQQERGNEPYALHLLGEVAMHGRGADPEVAGRHIQHALERAVELGMRPLAAHCHLGLGKVGRHAGQRQEALRHLATATEMYRDMRMPFYLEQAQTEMRALGGRRQP
jgi:tetratricopeptide (TPR) repeat protein